MGWNGSALDPTEGAMKPAPVHGGRAMACLERGVRRGPCLAAGAVGDLRTLLRLRLSGAPLIERLQDNRALSGALAAITAAVVGVITNLAVWFGLRVLFRDPQAVQAGPV